MNATRAQNQVKSTIEAAAQSNTAAFGEHRNLIDTLSGELSALKNELSEEKLARQQAEVRRDAVGRTLSRARARTHVFARFVRFTPHCCCGQQRKPGVEVFCLGGSSCSSSSPLLCLLRSSLGSSPLLSFHSSRARSSST